MSTATRFQGLAYRKDGAYCWRFVDRETDASIGAQYVTKAELLADLERFAAERGFADATAPKCSALVDAVNAWLEADSLSPGDCYDASGNPNANWGAGDRAKAKVRAALAALDKGGQS